MRRLTPCQAKFLVLIGERLRVNNIPEGTLLTVSNTDVAATTVRSLAEEHRLVSYQRSKDGSGEIRYRIEFLSPVYLPSVRGNRFPQYQ
jgi:hypothetical protein